MSIASKKATKAKKAKKDKLRREKARLARAKQAQDSKSEKSEASEKDTAIPGKPELKNDWLPLKGKSVGKSSATGHRPQGK